MAEYLKIPEVARRLDVSEKTARRYVKAGALSSTFIGGAYRVTEEDLEEFVHRAEVKPEDASPKVESSSLEPSLFYGIEDERLARYQHSWHDFIRRLTNRIAAEADGKGYAPGWILEISEIPRDITKALFDNGVLGKRDTFPTEAEWRRSWEIFDALDELGEAVERAWRAQMRESEHLEQRREEAAKLSQIGERRKAAKGSKEARELEAIRSERQETA